MSYKALIAIAVVCFSILSLFLFRHPFNHVGQAELAVIDKVIGAHEIALHETMTYTYDHAKEEQSNGLSFLSLLKPAFTHPFR